MQLRNQYKLSSSQKKITQTKHSSINCLQLTFPLYLRRHSNPSPTLAALSAQSKCSDVGQVFWKVFTRKPLIFTSNVEAFLAMPFKNAQALWNLRKISTPCCLHNSSSLLDALTFRITPITLKYPPVNQHTEMGITLLTFHTCFCNTATVAI